MSKIQQKIFKIKTFISEYQENTSVRRRGKFSESLLKLRQNCLSDHFGGTLSVMYLIL